MSRARRAWVAFALLTGCVVVPGCGLPFGGSGAGRSSTGAAAGSPTAAGARSSTAASSGAAPATSAIRATVAGAERTHEIPTPAPAEKAAGGWRSPVQAVQVYAEWYINWTADTVATHLRVLAAIGVGRARSAMTLAAGEVAHDSSLKLGGIANSGTVEGIAPVTDERNVYAVVTRESTTATNTDAYQGLRPTWHVTLATVKPIPGRLWTISAWQPEN